MKYQQNRDITFQLELIIFLWEILWKKFIHKKPPEN